MITKATILNAFPEVMSREDIYEVADENYLHVVDTTFSDDYYGLEVKEYFGHTNERGEPCDSATDDDFHVVFEYRSDDNETYTRIYQDVTIFKD